MKKLISSLLLLAPVCASASVAINFQFDALRDSAGVYLSSASSSFVLIADSDGNGLFPTASDLLGKSVSDGQLIGGDSVFYAGTVVNDLDVGKFGSAEGAFDIDLATNGVVTNDRWAIFWFDGVGVGGTLAGGTNYGFFHSNTADQAILDIIDTAKPMIFQADGSLFDTIYLDTEVLGASGLTPTVNSPSIPQFSASLTVIPEASNILVGGLMALGLIRRRRN